jgi:hypothetical protein
MTPEIIRSAWAKSGILAGDPRVVDPQIVLKQLPGGYQEEEKCQGNTSVICPTRPLATCI